MSDSPTLFQSPVLRYGAVAIQVTIGASFPTAVHATDFYTTPGHLEKVEGELAQWCPDPTPTTPTEIFTCANATWRIAHRMAVHVSHFIADEYPGFDKTFAQTALRPCNTQARIMDGVRFNPANPQAYIDAAVAVAGTCQVNIDTAENRLDIRVDQASQNQITHQINCWVDPKDCQRPTVPANEQGGVLKL